MESLTINTQTRFFSISASLKNIEDKVKTVAKTADVTRSICNLNSNISSQELNIS